MQFTMKISRNLINFRNILKAKKVDFKKIIKKN